MPIHSGTWRFGKIIRVESQTKYVVQVKSDGTQKSGISGENVGKLVPARSGNAVFVQAELELIFRVLFPADWRSFIPKSSAKDASKSIALPTPRVAKRLCSARDTQPGAVLRFSPISSYSYPRSIQRDALVTFLTHNERNPPAQVKWSSGTTYWVNWEDLIDEVRKSICRTSCAPSRS